jgi:hypothetical protein
MLFIFQIVTHYLYATLSFTGNYLILKLVTVVTLKNHSIIIRNIKLFKIIFLNYFSTLILSVTSVTNQ